MNQIKVDKVFEFFKAMNQIPRISGHEEAVSNWIANFAKERGLAGFWMMTFHASSCLTARPRSFAKLAIKNQLALAMKTNHLLSSKVTSTW